MDENQIRKFIANGNIDFAIKFLRENLVDSAFEKEITIISSRFKSLKNKQIKGVIKEEELNLESNKIADSILELLDEIKDKENKGRTFGFDSKSKSNSIRLRSVIGIGLLIAVFGVFSYVKKINKEETPSKKESAIQEYKLSESVPLINLLDIKKKNDVISILDKNNNYLKKAYSTYSSPERTIVLKIFDYELIDFDYAIYSEGINAPDVLCLLKIGEVEGEINWDKTQELIKKFKTIDADKICEQLKNRKGLGEAIRECPQVAPILITKKRSNLSPADLEKFKEINLPTNTNSMYEILSSYDRFIERLNN